MDPQVKSYGDQSVEERIVCLDRMLNVVAHKDWREVYLYFADEAATYRRKMEEAVDWEAFVASRAVYLYLTGPLMHLSSEVKAQKEELENGMVDLPPPDYEIDY